MQLQAELRTQTGSSASRQARREGKVPVSLYGQDFEATSLLINRREFEALLKKEGTNAVFDVVFDGKTQKVILKDYKRAALADAVYTIDLVAISANQTLQVEVPLYVINDETIKEGIVEIIKNTILVETKPDSIPSSFELDVEGLEIGSTLSVSDIAAPEGVAILDDPELTVVSISAPTEEAEAVDADAETAEPEVIGESEEDSEGSSEE